MDDFVLNVRQIAQYPQATVATANDALLFQNNGLGGPYMWIAPADLVGTALEQGGFLLLAPSNGGIAWNGSAITSDGSTIATNVPLNVPSLNSVGDIFVAGEALATQVEVTALFDNLLLNTVSSFNGRTGVVQLNEADILRAGGILQNNPHFTGLVLAPTPWDPRTDNDQVATTAFVQMTICHWLTTAPLVQSFNGRSGAVTLTADDVTAAAYAVPGDYIRAPNPALGDVSDRVATCGFVDESLMDLQDTLQSEINDAISGAYAPINSPAFTGHPTAPTPPPGDNTGNIATTAFVHAAIVASTTGVASFNTRTGAVVLTTADVTAAGGAPLAGPVFTGNPQAPTLAPGNSSTSLATTAFVGAAIASVNVGVTSFNTRTGAVTLSTADITGAGGAVLASPAFTGSPTAPTQAPATSNTTIATTAFVAAAVAGSTAGVSSFNTRTGAVTLQANDINAVGGALLANPAFTGVPTAPTATVGTASTQLATTAFVQQAISAGTAGVSSWNTRTGAVTLTSADLTTAGGALLASPNFSGTPTTPTAAPGTSTTQVASTAFVQAALSAAPGGVSSFNSRTGAITLTFADVSSAGGAPINSPSFTGTPTGPTATAGTNSGQLATTQFVMSAISSSGGVNTFNGRAGAVVLNAADVQSAAGAVYYQSQVAPTQGTSIANTLWFNSINGQLYVNYVDPSTQAQSWVIANSAVTPTPQPPTRQVFLSGTGTYTKPAQAVWIEVEMVGGGGGGGNANGAGGNGGNTTFGASLTCNGGGGGSTTAYATTPPQGVGGTASGGDFNIQGGQGGGDGPATISGSQHGGGCEGGASPFGGAGRGYPYTGSRVAGTIGNASPNTGSGGGGGAAVSTSSIPYGGQGGSAGGYLRKIIPGPLSSYAYSVGTGGLGNALVSGSYDGAGNGAAGIIIVTEHYGS